MELFLCQKKEKKKKKKKRKENDAKWRNNYYWFIRENVFSVSRPHKNNFYMFGIFDCTAMISVEYGFSFCKGL